MEPLISQQPMAESAQNEPTADQSRLPAWRAPVITRIDIRQTMFGSLSGGDGMGQTTP